MMHSRPIMGSLYLKIRESSVGSFSILVKSGKERTLSIGETQVCIMAPDEHVFRISGPHHLTHFNWENQEDRKSVAASLIQGVYALECDRQRHRCGAEALELAPPWWSSFNFQLIQKLIDEADSSVFGAIYELKRHEKHLAPKAPKYVIAFRGTLLKRDSWKRDFELDVKMLRNGLHLTSRFRTAMQGVKEFASAGHANVWLAGHSLGSAVAMLAGKNMAKMGVFLESFLFNPVFLSYPIERSIKNQKLKKGIRIAKSIVTAVLAVATKKSEDPEEFVKLSEWVPSLFVNPADFFCSEYVPYFDHRKTMDKIGAADIERLATQNSITSIFLSVMGKESEQLKTLPSANLIINVSPSPNFFAAHEIRQWWRPDCQLQCQSYYYK
ncbi:hypothetical protein MRB53_030289 [Persea americana]|uniref:Uncharacterized protein n=1 Tax=Persea americana TaxID=3435 RepID=A0ACC2KL80_PERAE|nr:hypothetical protein MRB53_030289 [Persea americana]